MSRFGKEPPHQANREVKEGKVTNLKNSYKKGHRKVVVRERQAPQKTFTVDIPFKEAKGIRRKKSYSFNVYEEKGEDNKASRFGGCGADKKVGSIKNFLTDEAPKNYTGRHKPQFKQFGSDSDSSGRTKF